jgi:DNA-binding LacI/PurR family transcriptional regulator
MARPAGEDKVTVRTVATAVGVSPATVSNAYNRPHKLSAALRERILATARELGYPGPDPAARRLRRGRAGSIGLLFGEALTYVFQDPGAVAFLGGVAEATASHNASLQLIAALDAEDAGASLLANAIVDGLVVWSLPDRHPLLQQARDRRLPLVTHGGPRLDGVPFVGIDDRAAARTAAEHVLQLGHRDVAVVAFPFGPSRGARPRAAESRSRPAYRVTRERLSGYREAIDNAGAPPPAVFEVAVNHRDEGRAAALALLTATARRPTAILAMSDELAAGVLVAAQELGLQVPHDLSVVGFDDGPVAEQRGLTTIGQSLHDQGRACAQLLLEGGEARRATATPLAPYALVERATTGPPRPPRRRRR